MKRKEIKYGALLALLTMIFMNIAAHAAIAPTSRFFVNDYANVIDTETEDYIFEKSKEYNESGGPQVVVLTVPSLDGASLEEFSIETARDWGIGSKESDNGVLILLVMDSRDVRVEVGYGLEGVLNDGKCGRFIRAAAPQLSSGDYSGGIKTLYDAVIGELEEPTPDTEDESGKYDVIVAVAIIATMFLLLWLMKIGGGRGGHRGRRFFYGGWGGGYGGGGFSGGGGSFGGGGFSGGGGSFGGGGASGKF